MHLLKLLISLVKPQVRFKTYDNNVNHTIMIIIIMDNVNHVIIMVDK